MTNNEKIEQWLDEWLRGERGQETVEQLAVEENEPDVKLLLETHRSAAVAVQRYNILQQVQQVHNAYLQQTPEVVGNKEETAKVIPIRRPVRAIMRIAAAAVLVLAVVTSWQYFANSPTKLFSEAYSTYYIDKDRGENGASTMLMVTEFRANNFVRVTELYRQTATPGARECFLAGSAYLELNQPREAITVFQQLLDQNKNKAEKLYNDEAEYYQGLAHLKAGQYREAYNIFNHIRNDKDHTYQSKISRWWLFRLRWL
jgi:tetratricopeptide (TPR) repeat protein